MFHNKNLRQVSVHVENLNAELEVKDFLDKTPHLKMSEIIPMKSYHLLVYEIVMENWNMETAQKIEKFLTEIEPEQPFLLVKKLKMSDIFHQPDLSGRLCRPFEKQRGRRALSVVGFRREIAGTA